MRKWILISVLSFACGLMAGCAAENRMNSPQPPAQSVPMYGIHEISIACDDKFDNPFRDAACWATFTSPDGKTTRVEGFYYGGREWRIRFVPRQRGQWKWTAHITGGAKPITSAGAFVCEGTAGHGFLRISKANPFRYEYEDGTPFYPIGIQTCNFLQPDFDGPARVADGSASSQPAWRTVSTPEWLQAFKGAVNLVRTQFGQGRADGCSFCLIPAPPRLPKGATKPANPTTIPADRYDLDLAGKLDDTYQLHRAAGISQILILYQDMSLWGPTDDAIGPPCAFGNARDLVNYKSPRAANMPIQEQYIRYIVARYGCYVDIWEIFNEDSYAPDDYLAHLAGVIRRADPYAHLLTTNYARPDAAWCDLNTWHEYMGMRAGEVDDYVVGQIAVLKSYGKLVQNTEFGNQGKLGNVDPVKWRIAVWAAFMHESGILFWGMSGNQTQGRTGAGNSNAYIGPDSRQHFRVFNQLTRDLPTDIRPVMIGYTGHTDVRVYGLCNGSQGIVYIHHFKDHTSAFTGGKLMMQTGPGLWRMRWFDPADGRELAAGKEFAATTEVSTPQQYLVFQPPPVTIDVVARIERVGNPTPVTQPGR